jgi:hypothetical protein
MGVEHIHLAQVLANLRANKTYLCLLCPLSFMFLIIQIHYRVIYIQCPMVMSSAHSPKSHHLQFRKRYQLIFSKQRLQLSSMLSVFYLSSILLSLMSYLSQLGLLVSWLSSIRVLVAILLFLEVPLIPMVKNLGLLITS